MQLGNFALGAEAREADRRLAPGGEDERHSIRAAVEELADDVPHLGRVVDEVEVVEHERRGLAGHAAELAQEGVEHRVERRRRRRGLAEQAARRGAEVGNVDPHARRRGRPGSRPSRGRRDPVGYQSIRTRVRRVKSARSVVLP